MDKEFNHLNRFLKSHKLEYTHLIIYLKELQDFKDRDEIPYAEEEVAFNWALELLYNLAQDLKERENIKEAKTLKVDAEANTSNCANYEPVQLTYKYYSTLTRNRGI